MRIYRVYAMAVCVVAALQAEIDRLVAALETPQRSYVAGWPTWQGRLGIHDVVVARAGIGKVNTAALSALLWDRFQPSTLIFTGVAGAIDPELSVGDIVVAERTIQHDAGVVTTGGLERYQPGHIPFFNPTDQFGYAPSAGVLASVRSVIDEVELSPVRARRPSIKLGTIVTGDQFLQDPATRDRLFAELGAQAVEMEGAALAQFASRVGCDHIVVRSISDLAGEESDIDFERFLPEVAANSARFTAALIGRLEEDDRDLPIGS